MRFITLLFILLSFNIAAAFAQARPITCSSENNPDNSVSIFAESQVYGSYTVKLIFNSLEGYTPNIRLTSNAILVTIEYGKREIIKLTPDQNAVTHSFQYQYMYFPGVATRKASDSSFVYLMPASVGNHLLVSNVFSLSTSLGNKKTADFYGTGFMYKLADTLCASRAGIVFDCTDVVREGENENVFYKSSRNRIAIEHKDGSIGSYEALAPIHLLVTPGDHVNPGQPLAVFNKVSEKYTVLFSAYYLDEKKIMADNYNDNSSSASYIVYLPTHFFSGDNNQPLSLQANNNYTVQHPAEIISMEMSKKEKKKLGYK